MKGIRFLCLVVILIMALMLPTIAYAGKPDVSPNATNVEIVKKGVPLPQGSGGAPGPPAASGILGKNVTGTRYAIIVGISDYPGTKHVLEGGYDLSYADDDAEGMAFLLGNTYGFDNIQLLTDEGATRNAILNAITEIGNNVIANDEVVFFFSGHGARLVPKPAPIPGEVQVGIVTRGEEEYPLPGFGYIWDKELKEAFSGFGTDRIVFIFDSCLAGGMTDLAGEGRVICMACAKNGYAVEYGDDYAVYYDGGLLPPINHGLFTYFLLQGIELGTVETAFDYARDTLVWISRIIPKLQQIPCISDLFPDDLLL